MKDLWLFLSVMVFLATASICLGLGFRIGDNSGYKEAYRDMKAGTIDLNVNQRFPDLWVKYHMPPKRGE